MLLPESLQIQTIDYCNRKCVWCPNIKYDKTPDNLMSAETFTKILGDLKEAKYAGAVHLYLMGEPLCDPRIMERIQETRETLPENVVFISTNGDHLEGPEHIKELTVAGLTWMAISDYDQAGKFGYACAFPNVVVAAKAFLEPTFYNRAGHVDVVCRQPREVCEWPFRKAYINFKGDMILCCSDYDYISALGNVMDDSFADIYNGDTYRACRKAHIRGDGRMVPLCRKCNRIKDA